MSNSAYAYTALFCAVILPYLWMKASRTEGTKSFLFLLGTCLANGALVLALMLVITTRI